MLDANMGTSDGAVEVGKEMSDTNVNEAGQDDAQSSDLQPANSAETDNGNATANNQTNASDFVADQWSIKFRNKYVVPKTREELKNWAQLGYNYNKRNAELIQKEESFKQLDEKYKQLDQLNQLFEQRPDFKDAVYKVYHQFASGEIQPKNENAEQSNVPNIESHPLVQDLRSRLEKVEKGYMSSEEKMANESVEKEIGSLKSTHADEDWTSPDADTGETLEIEVLKHADKHNFPTLEAAYRDLRWESMQNTIKAKALKEAEEKRLAEARAGIVSKGGAATRQPQQKAIPRNATYDQLKNMALEDIR